MPFGHWKDFDDCLSDVSRRESYSDEVAHKVCGKLKAKFEKATDVDEEEVEKAIKAAAEEYMNSKPSPGKEDLREVKQNIQKGWEFDPKDILSSPRVVEGTFHVPKVDKDKELITKSAMMEAIPDFMHLPILHDFHRERVLGVIVKAWEEDDHFRFRALFKATHDVDDAWDKVQKGEYDHVSIYGSRIDGSPSCKHDPNSRTETCVTRQIRLDSISACDDNARNSDAIMGIAKSSTKFCNDLTDTFIKAETQNSNLIHGTQDGVNKPMDKDNCPLKKGDDNVGLLKKIWETLQQLVESDKKVHATIGKSDEPKESEETEMDEKKEKEEVKKAEVPVEKPVDEVKKAEVKVEEVKPPAEVKVNYDEIIKAKTDEISKAFETKIAMLEEKIKKLENEPIQKAQVIIAQDLPKEEYGALNYRAIEKRG